MAVQRATLTQAPSTWSRGGLGRCRQESSCAVSSGAERPDSHICDCATVCNYSLLLPSITWTVPNTAVLILLSLRGSHCKSRGKPQACYCRPVEVTTKDHTNHGIFSQTMCKTFGKLVCVRMIIKWSGFFCLFVCFWFCFFFVLGFGFVVCLGFFLLENTPQPPLPPSPPPTHTPNIPNRQQNKNKNKQTNPKQRTIQTQNKQTKLLSR